MTRTKRNALIFVVLLISFGLYSAPVWYIYRALLSPTIHLETLSASKEKLEEQYDVSYETFTAALGEPESFSVQTADGLTLRGWFYEHPAEAGCGLIFLHGSGVNRVNSLHFAHTLWDRGCDLAIYDQRTWGESEGKFPTYGFHEKHDLLAVMDWLQAKSDLERSQIGWAGISLGGAVALQAAPLAPEIAFIIADSPYKDLRSVVGDRLPSETAVLNGLLVTPAFWLAGLHANYAPNDVSPYLAATSIVSPVFLLHSQADVETFPYHSEEIASQLEPANSVLHLTDWGSRHGWDSINYPDEYKALVDDFLAEYVGEFGVTP